MACNTVQPHATCVNQLYPGGPMRAVVTAVPWSVPDKDYDPIAYTAAVVMREPLWADLLFPIAEWNAVDGSVDRTSYMGPYLIVDHLPQNPMGRTGIEGRGLLGRYGPNHATGNTRTPS